MIDREHRDFDTGQLWTAAEHTARLSLGSIGLEMAWGASCLAPGFALLCQQVLALEDRARATQRPLVQFTCRDGARIAEPASAEIIFDAPELRVFTTRQGYCLQCTGASLRLDLDQMGGQIELAAAIKSASPHVVRGLMSVALMLLMQRCGRFGLHANSLAWQGQGYLVAGGSGCGKTTLALALIRQGWAFVCDDAVLLGRTPAGIQAMALTRGFACTDEMARHFSELVTDHEPAPGAKRILNVAQTYGAQRLARCRPAVLLFARIADCDESQLETLKPSEALVGLVQASAGIMVNRALVQAQMQTLRDLVAQTRSYALVLGRDVYEHPSQVAELLAEA